MLTDQNGTRRPKIFINHTTVRFLIVIAMNNSHELVPEDPWETIRKAVNSSVADVIHDRENRTGSSPHSSSTGSAPLSTPTAAFLNNVTNQIFFENTSGYMNNTPDLRCAHNVSYVCFNSSAEYNHDKNWYYLGLLIFVMGGVLGNGLVCAAIGLEKKLQSRTNYFLMSLAVADLLVSLVVMPFGIFSGINGKYLIITPD